MSKEEAACTMGRGCDGTDGGGIFRGKNLQWHLRDLESIVDVEAEVSRGPSGKDRLISVREGSKGQTDERSTDLHVEMLSQESLAGVPHLRGSRRVPHLIR